MQSDRLPQLNNDDQSNTDQSDDVTNSNNVLLRAKIENYHKDTLNWESTGNKDNPRNWPFWKRVFHTAMPALMSFAVTLATSTYTPAIPYVQMQFGVSRELAIVPLSLYALGMGIGPLLAAPLSELFGRRIIYLLSMPLFLVFTSGAGAARNIQTLIVCRFLAGTLGTAPLAIGAGTISDIWDLERDGGIAGLLFIMAPFLGPCLGPLTGAYIISEYNNDWRYSMWVALFVGAPMFVLSLFMNETLKAHILRTKSRDQEITKTSAVEQLSLKQVLIIATTRPVRMLFTESLVFYLSIYTAFGFAMLFSFFGSYPLVFMEVYHFNMKGTGLAFIGILVGFIFAVITFAIIDKTVYQRAMKASIGRVAPEHRLYAAMIGSIMLPISLFWYAWTPHTDIHWIVPVLAGVPFGWSTLCIFLSSITYLVDVYESATGASALAANGIPRYAFCAAFPLFTLQMYESRLGIHWATSVFAFVSVLMLPIPWVFFKYGRRLRARSGYDTLKD